MGPAAVSTGVVVADVERRELVRPGGASRALFVGGWVRPEELRESEDGTELGECVPRDGDEDGLSHVRPGLPSVVPPELADEAYPLPLAEPGVVLLGERTRASHRNEPKNLSLSTAARSSLSSSLFAMWSSRHSASASASLAGSSPRR